LISEKSYILPMFQYFQPVVMRKGLTFQPHTAGYVMPSLFKKT
jgi:peptide/nickel transport system substrate-binding protein